MNLVQAHQVVSMKNRLAVSPNGMRGGHPLFGVVWELDTHLLILLDDPLKLDEHLAQRRDRHF